MLIQCCYYCYHTIKTLFKISYVVSSVTLPIAIPVTKIIISPIIRSSIPLASLSLIPIITNKYERELIYKFLSYVRMLPTPAFLDTSATCQHPVRILPTPSQDFPDTPLS